MPDRWMYCPAYQSPCKVLDEEVLWGESSYRIWLPDRGQVVRVPRSSLTGLDVLISPEKERDRISYVTLAARVAQVLEGEAGSEDEPALLAPMESNVIPLPHQLNALSRAVSGDAVRYLLADEVGLGKTIEAGLIMRELKLRGLVRRILVVAPKGIATQWIAEMELHFNEEFQLVLGEDIGALDKVGAASYQSGWSVFDQVVVSLDSVKPMQRRRGWSDKRIAEYNRSRFEGLINAQWDLIVVDEAHRLGGSTEQVARYRLGKGLAGSAPYLLLLSATPHQGKTDAFHRLMSLLDEEAFPEPESISRERVAPYVIRTEKRDAIDANGQPLFKPRKTETAPVAWTSRHELQRQLYEGVTEYAREGYNQAMREKKRHIGFLMILMQRLMVSSTSAIRTTLNRRLNALTEGQIQASRHLESLDAGLEDAEDFEELYDLDGQALLDELIGSHAAALESEAGEVEALLSLAEKCEQAGTDAKAEALIDWIYRLQAEESDPDLKVLIFTEFVPTQGMLKGFLEARGLSVAILNGSMGMDERKQAQESFRNECRVLISTDAGGEGLNLQFAHVVINYDIPWNPMRREQRIGRVDRIGQPKVVRAINFVFEDSVEYRVREVLEQKLGIIFKEFGIDKTGDVLDSANAGEMFEGMFTSALLNPDEIEHSVEQTMKQLREEIHHARESSAIYGLAEQPDAKLAEALRSHPLPDWIERMTVAYIAGNGGTATHKRSWWDLEWPDGTVQRKCVFRAKDAVRLADATLLNLENRKIRELVLKLPLIVPGQPIPRISLDGLPAGLQGSFGLFEIRVQCGLAGETEKIRLPAIRRGFLSVFVSTDGKLFLPTARHVWNTLQSTDPKIEGTLDNEISHNVLHGLTTAAETAGQKVFDALKSRHLEAIQQEQERGQRSFEARQRAIEQIGLPEVRNYRRRQCEAEKGLWESELEQVRGILPEIRPLLALQIGMERQQ